MIDQHYVSALHSRLEKAINLAENELAALQKSAGNLTRSIQRMKETKDKLHTLVWSEFDAAIEARLPVRSEPEYHPGKIDIEE